MLGMPATGAMRLREARALSDRLETEFTVASLGLGSNAARTGGSVRDELGNLLYGSRFIYVPPRWSST